MGSENSRIAQTTGMLESDVDRLHEKYQLMTSTAGEKHELNEAQFVSKFPPQQSELATMIFNAMDINKAGVVDFREFCMAVAVLSQGSKDDKVNFTFALYDRDRKGYIGADDLRRVVTVFKRSSESLLSSLGVQHQVSERAAASTIFESMRPAQKGRVSREEFRAFCNAHPEVFDQVEVTFNAIKRAAYWDWDVAKDGKEPHICSTM